jgi:hypothetical protein
VAVHGLVDLPFRCPAVLQLWLVVFALLPILGRPLGGNVPAAAAGGRERAP